MSGIEFKKKDIECNFTYIYNDDLSLVIDVIRHYNKIVFRGFAVTRDGKFDFSRLFPNPDELPFSGRSGGDSVKMDFDKNTIEGGFQGEAPISFQLSFAVEDHRFSSTAAPDWVDKWAQKVPFLKDLILKELPHGVADLTKAFSLLHEDFPLVKFGGDVKIGTKSYHLNESKGSIAHHWGWLFPDYVFLMCNDFPDPETLLTLSFVNATTRLGMGIRSGYLYLRHNGEETKLVSPLNGEVIYFREGGKLSVIARSEEDKFIRVNIDHNKGAVFPHIFNTDCATVMNAECEVEGIGKSNRAVLDVKGLVSVIR